ncbi:MAG: hypothetical protein P4L74_06265 [Candidatus Doudnabacteria bacterium]|nr:hypothetical protein [Candidatus Doudnabacteria bacterium]
MDNTMRGGTWSDAAGKIKIKNKNSGLQKIKINISAGNANAFGGKVNAIIKSK